MSHVIPNAVSYPPLCFLLGGFANIKSVPLSKRTNSAVKSAPRTRCELWRFGGCALVRPMPGRKSVAMQWFFGMLVSIRRSS